MVLIFFNLTSFYNLCEKVNCGLWAHSPKNTNNLFSYLSSSFHLEKFLVKISICSYYLIANLGKEMFYLCLIGSQIKVTIILSNESLGQSSFKFKGLSILNVHPRDMISDALADIMQICATNLNYLIQSYLLIPLLTDYNNFITYLG